MAFSLISNIDSFFIFFDDIKISQKSLSLHTFSWVLSLFSALKELRKFKQWKLPLWFEVFYVII